MSGIHPAGETILVVDDEPNLRSTLALILQRAMYSVTTAGSTAEARQYLQAGPFDVLFLDLKMPGEDGLVFLPEVRKQYPDMPVLILTAHATLESAIEAVRLGARDYLLKPIDPEQILTRVSAILVENGQPRRRKRIVGEIQALLQELSQINGKSAPDAPASAEPAPPAHESTRYLQRGPFSIDLHTRHVTFNNRPIILSPTAFDYLVTLVRHSPQPISYETLVTESQGYRPTLLEARDMARWRIHELRRALEADSHQPEYIITVRGVGYRLVT